MVGFYCIRMYLNYMCSYKIRQYYACGWSVMFFKILWIRSRQWWNSLQRNFTSVCCSDNIFYKIEWRYWTTTNLIIILKINSICLFSTRNSITIKRCKQEAWIAFGKYIIVLLDRNIICQLQLQFVDVYIGSAIFVGICILSMTTFNYRIWIVFNVKCSYVL